MRGAIPIHGFLTRTDQWQVVEAKADGKSAWVTSRLEFFKQPMWMKQWPFAHTIEITYRLQDGMLEVQTKITNHERRSRCRCRDRFSSLLPAYRFSARGMDGFHSCAVSAGCSTAARCRRARPNRSRNSFPSGKGTLKDYNLDDVFSDLARDAQGRATVVLKGRKQQLEISQGPNYKSLVIVLAQPAEHRPGQPDRAAESECAAGGARRRAWRARGRQRCAS